MSKTPVYHIDSIAEIVGGEVIRLFNNNQIERLSIDSRKIINPESLLFFALKGPQHDGHQFIRELYNRGVRNFVVSHTRENIDLLFEANIIRVADTRQALQDLAAHHRTQCAIPTIGITGSNGKTIVKEWLYQLLQHRHNIVRSPKSYNSQVGVPLSVWGIEGNHNLGIFEAGISEPGEMENLQQIVRPNIGIFNNLREAHDAQFETRNAKAAEKLKLFKGAETLIVNGDSPEISAAISGVSWLDQTRIIRFSFKNADADYFVSNIDRIEEMAVLTILHNREEQVVRIPFNDNGSIQNALACYATACELGVSRRELVSGLATLQPVAMRLQLIEGINGCSIVNDAYNSDMGSLEIALDFANQQRFLKRKTLILSDILQSGISAQELYSRVADMCQRKEIDRIIGIGPDISAHQNLFSNGTFYPHTEAFLDAYRSDMFHNELVLVKGARSFRFERISRLLEQKLHETVLEIRLDALIHNLNYFRSKLAPHVSVMVMVKAFSYGMGSAEIAHLLEYNKVDYLAVAYTDEGVALRKSGVKVPIMVMNPEVSSYEAIIRYQLEPELYSIRTINAFVAACKAASPEEPQHVHLKFDTGMHRLGFTAGDMEKLEKGLKDFSGIRVTSAFSHLAAAGSAKHDDFTLRQIDTFRQITQRLKQVLGYNFKRHILNSAGVLRFPNFQFDMIRLGIGLYGYLDHPEAKENVQVTSRLKTIISQVKHLKSGDTVGYNRAGVINGPTKIAILPVGYADGFSRRLGNGAGEVSIGGYRAKTVGDICMDMCMVDVSEIPCHEGDAVEVFGEDISLPELADKMKTIPYEVITGISRRVKRVYIQD